MKRLIIVLVVVSILVAGVVAIFLARTAEGPSKDNMGSSEAKDLPLPSETNNQAAPSLSAGRYIDYSADAIKSEGYDVTILFFHAPWCPECRAFDTAIKQGTVPQGIQILKIDYDSSQDLRQRYGVTIQSSFVRVDKDGNKQKSWSGYGKEKSIDAIIENTK